MSDHTKRKSSAKLWGGRFAEATEASVEEFTASVHYDARLYRQDIMGSKAHARMLARQGLITDEECDAILGGLESIRQDIEDGSFVFRPELEDKNTVLDLPADFVQSAEYGLALLFCNQSLAGQHPGMNLRSPDVLPVESCIILY